MSVYLEQLKFYNFPMLKNNSWESFPREYYILENWCIQ